MKVKKVIDVKKQYVFPSNIAKVKYKDVFIIIAVNQANWIILENDSQVQFFDLLNEYTIEEALNIFKGSKRDASNVVTQIEARQFTNINRKRNNGMAKMHIYLTNGCNLRCPHCYMSAGNKFEDELSFKEVCNIIDNFSKYGGEQVTFSGGEATIRPDLYDIVKYSYDRGLKTRIMTNGVLWDENMVEKFSHILTKVQISIDGCSESENARIRGAGSFEKSLATLDMFIKRGHKVDIAVTPYYDDNFKYKIDDYAQFGKNLINKYHEQVVIIFSGDILDGREIALTQDQKKEYSKLILELNKKCFGYGSEKAFVAAFKNNEIFNNCSYGGMTLAANGDVYLCAEIPNAQPVANIRNNTWEEIFEKMKKGTYLSEIENLKPCNSCELMYICGGGCRLKFFEEFKSSEILSLNPEDIKPKKCTLQDKEYYYDLMVNTNNSFFQ